MNLIEHQIGRYIIKERIGQGGMATVFKAHQADFDRYVAVKIMHSHLCDRDGFTERFQRETQLMSKLQHPHIVRVLDAGIDAGIGTQIGAQLPYMVLDYVDGGTLQDFLNGANRPTIEQALELAIQLVNAVAYMHSCGLIHRDIKPANILFSDHSHTHLLLTDFGFARLVAQDTCQLTMTGAIIGTPNYMSPEAVRGDLCDERNDIYGMGAVFYELLAGRAPYVADTPYGMMMKHATEPLPPIRDFNPNVPLVVEEILTSALAKEPLNRFQSATEFGEALRAARKMLLRSDLAYNTTQEDGSPWQSETVDKSISTPISSTISSKHTASSAMVNEIANEIADEMGVPTQDAQASQAPRKRRRSWPKQSIYASKQAFLILGSLLVVLICAIFTTVGLLLIEESVIAFSGVPAANTSPSLFQAELAALAERNAPTANDSTRADSSNEPQVLDQTTMNASTIVTSAASVAVTEAAQPTPLPTASDVFTVTPTPDRTPTETATVAVPSTTGPSTTGPTSIATTEPNPIITAVVVPIVITLPP